MNFMWNYYINSRKQPQLRGNADLIQCANYRSFADRQSISMSGSEGTKRSESFFFPSDNSIAPYILRSACLFGPNGSGK